MRAWLRKWLFFLIAAYWTQSHGESSGPPQIKSKTLQFSSESEISTLKSQLETAQEMFINNSTRYPKDHKVLLEAWTTKEKDDIQHSGKYRGNRLLRREQEDLLKDNYNVTLRNESETQSSDPNTQDIRESLEQDRRKTAIDPDFRFSETNDDTVLKKLKHTENYGTVFVTETNSYKRMYHKPRDFFRCGRCLCLTSSQDGMVRADCVTTKDSRVLLYSIPQFLPVNTVHLDLMNNPIKDFEFNKLAIYTSLLTFNATNNLVKSLRKSNCVVPLSVRSLDLSHNGISSIEDGSLSCMPNLTELVLKNNAITELTNDSFCGLLQLKTLILTHNKLNNIQPRAFVGFGDLRVLDLSFNRRLGLPKRYVQTFKQLARLESLNIIGVAATTKHPTELLLAMPSLQELAVNGLRHPFDKNLSALNNVTKLVYGSFKFCWTKNFTKSYFRGFVHLKSLHIQGCKAEEYSPDMFDANPQIIDFELSLAKNIKNQLSMLCNLRNLQAIKSIEISNILKTHGKDPPVVLSRSEVKCLSKMKSLVSLNLDDNLISQVSTGFTFNLPPSLETFSLRRNLLTSRESVIRQFCGLMERFPNLKRIFEDSQSQEKLAVTYQNTPFPSKRQDTAIHRVLDMSSEEAKSNLLNSRKHKQTPFYRAQRTVLGKDSLPTFSIDVYSSSNSIKLGINFFTSNGLIQVGIFNVSGTFITNWGTSPAKMLPHRDVIADLSNNKCQYIRQSFFNPNNSLVELHAHGNFLSFSLGKDTSGSLLSRLSKLEYLDLSKNQFYSIPWLLFQGLRELRVLKLSFNNINIVDFHVAHMTSLVYIDFSRNSIWAISERTRYELDWLASKSAIYIDLTFNPLPCTCEGTELFRWLSSTRVHLISKDLLVCTNKNLKIELVGDLLARHLDLQRTCFSEKLLILSIIFSCVVVLLLVGFVWSFQKRWWIVYMWNLGVSRLYGFKPSKTSSDTEHAENQDNPPHPTYSFDAFFVYVASNADFVLDEVLDQLEVKRNHRVCVEDRDFLAGSYIPCNITSAVRSSKTTVVVLDETFRAVGWTQYAVEMAQVEAVRSKRNVLHLLMLGSPPEGHLPGVYLKIFRQGHFSELPPKDCPADVREQFWDSFSQTLGHTDRRGNRPRPRLEVAADGC